GENDLLFHTDVVVTTAVERTSRNTTEVAHTRQSHGDQAIQEFVHALTTQRNHATDGVILTDLEPGDCLASFGDDRLLAGDLGHVANSVLDDLLVCNRFRNTHVQGDFRNARNLHHTLVPKLLGEL